MTKHNRSSNRIQSAATADSPDPAAPPQKTHRIEQPADNWAAGDAAQAARMCVMFAHLTVVELASLKPTPNRHKGSCTQDLQQAVNSAQQEDPDFDELRRIAHSLLKASVHYLDRVLLRQATHFDLNLPPVNNAALGHAHRFARQRVVTLREQTSTLAQATRLAMQGDTAFFEALDADLTHLRQALAAAEPS